MEHRRPHRVLGMIGAALFYGDSVITPAISVLGAMEGLDALTPVLKPYVVPLTVLIVVALFAVQRFGTGKVGTVFGPIMVLWFSVLAILGVRGILINPDVFWALNPLHGVQFFLTNGHKAFVVLGSVFLVATGAEAMFSSASAIATTSRSNSPQVFGLVSMIAATCGPSTFLTSSGSTVPSGRTGIDSTLKPISAAVAGLVPCAESGTSTVVRVSPSPRAAIAALIAIMPASSPCAPAFGLIATAGMLVSVISQCASSSMTSSARTMRRA